MAIRELMMLRLLERDVTQLLTAKGEERSTVPGPGLNQKYLGIWCAFGDAASGDLSDKHQ